MRPQQILKLSCGIGDVGCWGSVEVMLDTIPWSEKDLVDSVRTAVRNEKWDYEGNGQAYVCPRCQRPKKD